MGFFFFSYRRACVHSRLRLTGGKRVSRPVKAFPSWKARIQEKVKRMLLPLHATCGMALPLRSFGLYLPYVGRVPWASG